jgi:hypothetical protein
LIDRGIFLEGQHESLPIGHRERAHSFNGQHSHVSDCIRERTGLVRVLHQARYSLNRRK